MTNTTLKQFELDGFSLKMIAIITMLVDHIGAGILEGILSSYYPNGHFVVTTALKDYPLLMGTDIALRLIGRLAFPIFCFFIIEGFLHTRNVTKYALRLAIFGILSEIPFDLLFDHTMFSTKHQNVYFTLLLGLIFLILFEAIKKEFSNVSVAKFLQVVAMVLIAVLAELLHTDYGASGIFTIAAMYIYHQSHGYRAAMAFGTILLTISNLLEVSSLADIALISHYNGKRGRSIKYFFYAFYPLHLLLLSLLYFYIIRLF